MKISLYVIFAMIIFAYSISSVSAHYDPQNPNHTHDDDRMKKEEMMKVERNAQKTEDRPLMRPEDNQGQRPVLQKMEGNDIRREDRPASDGAMRKKREDRMLRITDIMEQKEMKKEERREIVKEKLSDRCKEIVERAETSMSKHENSHRGYVERFTHMVERLDKAVTALAAKGHDTAALEASVEELMVKIEKLNEDHAAFIASLQDVNMDCENNQATPSAAFTQSRELLEVVREDVMDIRAYYQTNVRAQLLQLKKQAEEVPATPSAAFVPMQ